MNKELADIMKEAYGPCDGFRCVCGGKGILWNPKPEPEKIKEMNIPRGFYGATGEISDVKLVLVLAEPGKPDKEEWKYYNDKDLSNEILSDPSKLLDAHNNYVTFKNGGLFHENIRNIVRKCFDKNIEEVKNNIWITETVLCSVPGRSSTGPMTREVEDECGKRYLKKQYDLFKNAFWVAAGRKAQRRLKILEIPSQQYTYIYHPSCRPIHKIAAKESWDKLAEDFKKWRNI